MGLFLVFWIILVFTVVDQNYKPILGTRTNFNQHDFANLNAAAEHNP